MEFIASLLLYGVIPFTLIEPASIFSIPDKSFMSVVFPEPFLPHRPTIIGFASEIFTFFRAKPIIVGLRSEEHTSELQSRGHLVCRLLLEKKKTVNITISMLHID